MAALLSAVKGAAESVADKVESAADAVVETVKEGGLAVLCKKAEDEVKKHTGEDISVDTEDIPDGEWKTWMMKTGINSICNEDTWDFLEEGEYNARKVQLWKDKNVKKITLTVQEEYESDYDKWIVAFVEYKENVASGNEMIIKFCPRAFRWASDNSWIEDGYKRWWNLRDEIVFGLQLYQLPGKCFYKSDFLVDGVQDDDADSPSPIAKKKGPRWVQFRHWVIFWYGERGLPGWNYQWTTKPPKNADGSLFSLDSVLSLPSMPDVSMPSISLPSLPNIEMPSLPDAPSMPSIEAPSVSAPDLSNVSMPSIPDKKLRPKNPWAAHGVIQLNGLKAFADGDKITLHNAKVTHFYEDIANEDKEEQKFEFKASSAEQAKSWLESLKESGVKEEEPSGCCTVA